MSTYSLSFPNSEDGYNTYLVPVIDMTNHAPLKKANVAIQMQEDGFIAKAIKDIKEGDEVIVLQATAQYLSTRGAYLAALFRDRPRQLDTIVFRMKRD